MNIYHLQLINVTQKMKFSSLNKSYNRFSTHKIEFRKNIFQSVCTFLAIKVYDT